MTFELNLCSLKAILIMVWVSIFSTHKSNSTADKNTDHSCPMHYIITSSFISPFLLCNIRVYFEFVNLFYSYIVSVVLVLTVLLFALFIPLAAKSINT